MSERDRSAGLALAAFTALSVFAALHWAALVSHPPAARAILSLLVVSAGAAALIRLGRSEFRSAARHLLAALILTAALVVALAVIGIPARLAAPWNWGQLGDALHSGFEGIEGVDYPYTGSHPWSREVVLAAIPLALTVAAALAFWPRRRRSVAPTGALAVIVALYAIAVITSPAGQPLARGLLVFLLAAAWLWLPRIRGRQALAATALVVASGLLAVPVASALDADDPWIDYSDWDLDFSGGRGGAEAFDWNHSYGPLDWERTGKRVLEVRSSAPHYWRAAVLDSFDGVGWLASPQPPAPGADLPAQAAGADPRWDRLNSHWIDWIEFEVDKLRSRTAISAGPVKAIRGTGLRLEPSGAVPRDGLLEEGDVYSVQSYAPAPSESRLRAAPEDYPWQLGRFATVDYPAPYASVLGLARRWTAGAPTTYDAVRAIERHLQHGFDYSEDVARHRFPLRAFLLSDRVGYCQQFSGAMALMLRLLGIPSRVAAGFSPGERDGDRFVVRDTDAHSWVEVYFGGIGWVPFDPTPAASPAQLQRAGVPAIGGVAGGGAAAAPQKSKPAPAPRTAAASSSGGISLLVPGLATAAILVLVSAPFALRRRRCRALPPRALADAQLRELEAALPRLGHPLRPGTTLRELERRHGRRSAVAAYAAGLRSMRFAPGGSRPPSLAQRRRVRRELGSAAGLRSRLRALLAIPPGGPRPGLP